MSHSELMAVHARNIARARDTEVGADAARLLSDFDWSLRLLCSPVMPVRGWRVYGATWRTIWVGMCGEGRGPS